jgi:hypothetical protein
MMENLDSNRDFDVRDLFKNRNKITLNVGGTRHEILWRNIECLPHSRLGRIRLAKSQREVEELCDFLNLKENEIFFDKHNATFDCIINFYRTRKLHLYENVCVLAFHEDLIYWGIDECFLDNCCHMKYHARKDQLLEEVRKEEECEREKITVEKFVHCFPAWRKKLWDLVENPQTSRGARVRFFY